MSDMKRKDKEYLLSIIIATYNAGEYLGQCLESISLCAPPSAEVVVVDGGSSDQTLDILHSFRVQNCVSEKDKGIYDAMNKGIDRARGQWLYFLGADDSLLPGFVEIAACLREPATIYYGDTRPVFKGDHRPAFHLLSGKFDAYRLAKYPVNHQAVIYPAAVFETRKYDTRYRIFADYALNLSLWDDDTFRKQYVSVTIANYNMTGVSSVVTDTLFRQDKSGLILKHLGWFVWLRYRFKKWKKRLKGEDWC